MCREGQVAMDCLEKLFVVHFLKRKEKKRQITSLKVNKMLIL